MMLRSWVQYRTDKEPDHNPERDARREATDRAGIEAALKYERDAGRHPEPMPHDNPGYDIESYVGDELVRYIEVKAQSGEWRNNAPSLSSTQHDRAYKEKDKFWLYIVELAGLPGEQLYPINDPIGRATHFGFDPGWRDVAIDLDLDEAEFEEAAEDG